jgi:hypothetical protein
MTEELIAKKIGANLVKNSGRNMRKGDMRLEIYDISFLIDAKEGASFSFTESAWAKVCTDAATWGTQYIPMILRATPKGSLVACIPFDELIQIIEEREINNERK